MNNQANHRPADKAMLREQAVFDFEVDFDVNDREVRPMKPERIQR